MRRGLYLITLLVLGGCKCVDSSTLTATRCEANGTCKTGQCCGDGYCRAECAPPVDAGSDGGTPRLCSPVNCRGCCNGDICEIGITPDTCGQGGQSCQSCPAGDECQGGGCSGCTPENCSTGCCFAGVCETPSASRCAADGGVCRDCALEGGDSCESGMCKCGSNPACGLGQACVNGVCECNASTCPGCCESGQCVLTPTFASCGGPGSSCSACSAASADRCTGGACVCGAGANAVACGPGQICVNEACECDPANCAGCCAGNQCVTGDQNTACGAGGVMCQSCNGNCVNAQCEGCNATSCPNGCCNAGACVDQPAQNLNTCGRNGNFCSACNLVRADNCGGGRCQCGANPQCAQGQHCVAGACVCDATSCSGCCQGGVCVGLSGQDADKCGVGANVCAQCAPRGDTCASGVCRCGGASQCAAGQECVGGVCQCTSTSCMGCCQGNVCTDQTQGNVTDGGAVVCGISGVACTNCTVGRSDHCNAAGNCRCGNGPKCTEGLACVGGACVCNGSSCPLGCCAGPAGPCMVPTEGACGIGGSLCAGCPTGIADRCVGGVCSCGPGGAVCGAGSECSDGVCECRPDQCLNGCCSGAQCVSQSPEFPSVQFCGMAGTCAACTGANDNCTNSTGLCEKCDGQCAGGCCNGSDCNRNGFPFCGVNGEACVQCRDGGADRCIGDRCSCGLSGKACPQGETCVSGQCVCDPATCMGCCAGGVAQNNRCVTPGSVALCGAGGGSCAPCLPANKSDRCDNGACRCGNGPPCQGQNTCQAGQCLP